MNLPDRLQLPFAFEPASLARDLGALSGQEWIDHFITDRYEGGWNVLPLRGPASATHPIMMISIDPNERNFKDTPMLEACPYFREVIAAFRCEVRSVRLLRLTPGSLLKEHSDPDSIAQDGIVRLHIPVVTNDEVEFLLNQSRVVMEPGSVWYLRLSDRHSVANKGATDRVHMIVDTILNDWMKAMLEQAMQQNSVPGAA